MFALEFHQKISQVLLALNVDFFQKASAYFGGGTLLALAYNEYRWSKDIDFVCPVGEHYRYLRSKIMEEGYQAIFQSVQGIQLPREIKADQYGIRFPVVIDNTLIKFEIIAEARIHLESPVYLNWLNIPCLSFVDRCCEKLLANADRWNDTAVESRDLIDLAMLRLASHIPQLAFDKAEAAYDVKKPLFRALNNFQQKPEYRQKCFDALHISKKALIIDGIDALALDLGLLATQRTEQEIHLDEYGLPIDIP